MKHTEIFTGNIGKVDDLIELSNGNCVVNFSVAETPRIKEGDEWKDGETVWTNVSIFGHEARNLVKSVKPGTPVIVVGTRSARSYIEKDTNEKRVVQSVTATEVGVLINKFTFIEKLGSVNYYKDNPTSAPAPARQARPAQQAAPASEEDVFGSEASFDDGDLFGDDSDDLFGI